MKCLSRVYRLVGIAALLAATAVPAQSKDIVAAADVGYAPFAVSNASGKFEGIDIDIAAALSKEMGIHIKVIDQPWSATIPGLIAGKFDMILAPATITEERAKNVLFSEGYGDATFGFLLNASGSDVAKLEDLRGKTVATNKGNLFDRWITGQASKYDINVSRFDKNSDAAAAVASGQADAAIMYTASAGWLAKKNPVFKASTYYVDRGAYFGYAFNKKDVDIRNKVDAALECLKKKGIIAKIFVKWTGIAPVKGGMTATPVPGYGPKGFSNYDASEHKSDCKP